MYVLLQYYCPGDFLYTGNALYNGKGSHGNQIGNIKIIDFKWLLAEKTHFWKNVSYRGIALGRRVVYVNNGVNVLIYML